jgi:hypothetical protein
VTGIVRTGIVKKVTIEATGGHHELSSLVAAVQQAVTKLREQAQRDDINYATSIRPPAYIAASINLEGTIRIETEDEL